MSNATNASSSPAKILHSEHCAQLLAPLGIDRLDLYVPTRVAAVDGQLAKSPQLAVNADHMNLEHKLASACIPAINI
jgi:hypothetical protein